MQTPKASGSSSSEPPQKVRPRAVRQLKTTGLESDSASSPNQARTLKDNKSLKIIDRRSPRSPVTEKKRPSRISDLEFQVCQLQEELKKAKDQLSSSESWKKEAAEDAEESKKQLLALSAKLEESQKQHLESSASEQTRVVEHSQGQVRELQSGLEATKQHNSVESTALASALSEIQQLKCQLEMVAESGPSENKRAESADLELQTLRANLTDTLSLVENMKSQLRDTKDSEAQAQALASETLRQLETAKKSVEALHSDGSKAIEAYNSVASELAQSRGRIEVLERLVGKLESDLHGTHSKSSLDSVNNHEIEQVVVGNQRSCESNQLEAEVNSLRTEVEQLRSALEAADVKCHEEQINSTVQIKSAHELVEQMKTGTLLREAELEGELKQAKADIEELKADLMDKETELQGISEENEGLSMKLKNSLSCQGESERENEMRRLKENVAKLKMCLMDKETELQNIMEENEKLKVEIRRREVNRNKGKDEAGVELEAARAAEREALMKLGFMMEEADRSNKKVARVTEQLEAAQAANSEMEAELRKLKVQSDQWRKAAEAAAAMLSSGNNGKVMERTGSLDSSYNPVIGKINSPYNDDMDDDLLKRKNGNMLKKIGVLWKRPQK